MGDWNFFSGGFPILDMLSDDAEKGSNPEDAVELLTITNFTFNSSYVGFYRWYSSLYKTIKRANIVIDKVPEIAMDENLKNRLIAEARLIRALCYFDLVKAFGDVPKITTSTPPLKISRSSKIEIYNDIIIDDLKFAINHLPVKSSYTNKDIGRVTLGAARALLAKVYLYLNDFENTEKYVMDIITSGQYNLEPDFTNVFSSKNIHGIESIFELGAIDEMNRSLGGIQYGATQGVRGTPNKGWGFNRPSWNLINFFEKDDIRKDATIIFLGEVIDSILIIGDEDTPDITYTDETETEIKEIETYNQKVWVKGNTTQDQWGYNIHVIRYAEILLIAAEVLNENNKPSEALIYLNMIRRRADLTEISEQNIDLLRPLIWKERRAELALERDRFFDLIRQGRAGQVLGPLGFIEGKHELLPIPQIEIDLSEGNFTQNPGY